MLRPTVGRVPVLAPAPRSLAAGRARRCARPTRSPASRSSSTPSQGTLQDARRPDRRLASHRLRGARDLARVPRAAGPSVRGLPRPARATARARATRRARSRSRSSTGPLFASRGPGLARLGRLLAPRRRRAPATSRARRACSRWSTRRRSTASRRRTSAPCVSRARPRHAPARAPAASRLGMRARRVTGARAGAVPGPGPSLALVSGRVGQAWVRHRMNDRHTLAAPQLAGYRVEELHRAGRHGRGLPGDATSGSAGPSR